MSLLPGIFSDIGSLVMSFGSILTKLFPQSVLAGLGVVAIFILVLAVKRIVF